MPRRNGKRVCDMEVAELSGLFFCVLFLEVYNTSRKERPMSVSLENLETRRGTLLAAISGVHDMRPGSIVGAMRRCGKPGCHCAQAGDPGHGPNLRLTYKARGKTVTEALPSNAAVRKAEQEIAEFRRFQKLSEELVEVSGQICRQRPVEDTFTAEEKKRPKRSTRRSRAK
jgi:hypothetical protein